MSNYDDLKKALTELITNRFTDKPRISKGILGDGRGNVIVPERPDKSYVRFNRGSTEFFEVFNRTVNPVYGWPVLIGELPWQPGLTQVMDTDWSAFEQSGWGNNIGATSPHAPTHEWPDGKPGSDPVNVYNRSIVPLRAYIGTSGTNVYINSYEYEYNKTGTIWGGIPGVDLSPVISSMPSGTMRFMGLYVDPETNSIATVTGVTTVFTSAFDPPLVQFPGNVLPSARVRVYGNQANINEADIRDARRLYSISPKDSNVWPLPGEIKIGATSYGTIQNAIDASAAGDVIKIGEGTYDEQLTVNAQVSIVGINRTSTVISSISYATLISIQENSVEIRNISVQNGYTSGDNVAIDIVDSYNIYIKSCNVSSLNTSTNDAIAVQVGDGSYMETDTSYLSASTPSGNGVAVYAPVGTSVPVAYLNWSILSGSSYAVDGAAGFEVFNNMPQLIGGIGANPTYYGDFINDTGVITYPADTTPAANDAPIWATGTSTWVPGVQKQYQILQSDFGGVALEADAAGDVTVYNDLYPHGSVYQDAGEDIYPTGNAAGIDLRRKGTGLLKNDDFDYTGEQPTAHGWSVAAGAPWTTPTFSVSGSKLIINNLSGQRSFLYKTAGSFNGLPIFGKAAVSSTSAGAYVGFRLDDGTDNNYHEIRAQVGSSIQYRSFLGAYRIGGGAVTTSGIVDAYALYDIIGLLMQLNGSAWTSWTSSDRLYWEHLATQWLTSVFGSSTWTPTRIGITCYLAATWNEAIIDYVGGNSF